MVLRLSQIHSIQRRQKAAGALVATRSILVLLLLLHPVVVAASPRQHLRQHDSTHGYDSTRRSLASLLESEPFLVLPVPLEESPPIIPVDSFAVAGEPPLLQVTKQIIGGAIALDEHEYFVTTASRTCGATLIHPDVILTAAHCQAAISGPQRVVYIGAVRLAGKNDFITTARRRVVRQYPYHSNNPVEFWHDLTLFKLDQPVNSVEPVTLNANPLIPVDDATLTVIGFGATSVFDGSSADDLQSVEIQAVNPDQCVVDYSFIIHVVSETMICAAALAKDSCHGDSGGPLLHTDSNTGQVSQVGIVSFGVGCGNVNYPGVYTRVSAYTDWIHDRVCDLSAVPPADCDKTAVPVSNPVPVTLHIQYDDNPTESFWRLREEATGKIVAFQPRLPDKAESATHKLDLQGGGTYTLLFLDTRRDGMCCTKGNGRIYVTAPESEASNDAAQDEEVTARSGLQVQVLAESDGVFEYDLALEFVVPVSVRSESDSLNPIAITVIVVVTLAVTLSIAVVLWKRSTFCHK